MKLLPHYTSLRSSIYAVAVLLAAGSTAFPAISGINTTSSNAHYLFDDTGSMNGGGSPGTTYPLTNPTWSGALFSTSNTDPTTLDKGIGDLAASFFPTSPALAIFDFLLTQPPPNTGVAKLGAQFSLEYQLDAAGLGPVPTYSPTFVLDGTVQSALGSFAKFSGTLKYYGVTGTSGVISLLDTVTYTYANLSPGVTFSGVSVPGLGGTTLPALASNTTLTMVGNFAFQVDPASLHVALVPEPTVCCMLSLAALPLLGRRRRG